MYIIRTFRVFIAVFFAFQSMGQDDTLSLEACFHKAKHNAFNFTTAHYERANNDVNMKFHPFSLLPNLSAFSGFNSSFGRRLDPITNTFGNSAINSQTIGLSSGVPVFSGLRYFRTRDNLKLIQATAEINLQQQENSIYTQVVSLYIDLCLQQTQIELSDQRVEHLESILSAQRELFNAGKITGVDTLRAANTILKETSQRFELMQTFSSSMLELNLLTGDLLTNTFYCDAESIAEVNTMLYPDEVFSRKKTVTELEALEVQRKLNTSSILPSISLNASIGSGFSTNNKDFAAPDLPIIPYNQQLSQNFNQGIGVNVNIPLFNRGEYLKSKRLQQLNQEKLETEASQLERSLEKKRIELTLQLKNKQFSCDNLRQSVDNLARVYTSAIQAYQAGTLTYSELQNVFMEWQQERINFQAAAFELARLKLLSKGLN